MEASATGRAAVVAALLDLAKDTNVNLTNKNGESALHLAVTKGFDACARLIVEAGAKLNI